MKCELLSATIGERACELNQQLAVKAAERIYQGEDPCGLTYCSVDRLMRCSRCGRCNEKLLQKGIDGGEARGKVVEAIRRQYEKLDRLEIDELEGMPDETRRQLSAAERNKRWINQPGKREEINEKRREKRREMKETSQKS